MGPEKKKDVCASLLCSSVEFRRVHSTFADGTQLFLALLATPAPKWANNQSGVRTIAKHNTTTEQLVKTFGYNLQFLASKVVSRRSISLVLLRFSKSPVLNRLIRCDTRRHLFLTVCMLESLHPFRPSQSLWKMARRVLVDAWFIRLLATECEEDAVCFYRILTLAWNVTRQE